MLGSTCSVAMKPIDKGELYKHLGGFLKSKGIELKEGAYTQRIQQGCALLSEVINVSHSSLKRAKAKAAKKLDEMRQVIHEKTAPKPRTGSPAPAKSSSHAEARAFRPARRKATPRRAARKTRKG